MSSDEETICASYNPGEDMAELKHTIQCDQAGVGFKVIKKWKFTFNFQKNLCSITYSTDILQIFHFVFTPPLLQVSALKRGWGTYLQLFEISADILI